MINKNFNLFSFFLILIIGLAIYSNSLDGEFLFDDGTHISKQENIKDLSRFTEWSTWTKVNDRPLSVFSLALNYHWGELNVVGYHIFNTLIHILSSFLVFLICRLILIRLKGFSKDKKRVAYMALFCALVFLTHPIQTQAVSYVIQRMTSMSALFYLGSVFFYIKTRDSYFQAGSWIQSITFFFLMGICAIAAVLSKQSAVSLPIAYLLVEFFFIRNKMGWINKRLIISCSITIILLLVIYAFVWELPKETMDISRGSYLITQFRVILKYFQLLVLPFTQNLDYNFRISNTLFGLEELFSLSVLLYILYAAYKLRHKMPLLAFGIFWIFIALSIESSLIPITDVIFEHRLYLGIFGYSLILLAIYHKFYHKVGPKYFRIAAIALILIYSSLTYARNRVWQTPLSLWKDVTEKSPDKSRPNLNLGIAYFHNSKPILAKKYFDKAIELKPDGWLAYFNRGETYLLQGDMQKAIIDFEKCILLKKDFPLAYDSRGIIKLQLRDYQGALIDFDKAIELKPDLASAWLNRANLKVHQQQYEEAQTDYNQALKLDPDFKEALNNRGQLYLFYKEYEAAYQDLIRAVSIDPKFNDAYNNLGKVFIAMKEFEMSIGYFDRSIALNDKNYKIYRYRATCYIELKRYKLALNDLIKARGLGDQIEDELIEMLTLKANEAK